MKRFILIMAIVHTRLKALSRSTRNTVAAVAYRSGAKLIDKETGEIFDYRHKSVDGVELLLPENASAFWKDLQKEIGDDRQSGVQRFSDIAESHEKRLDSQVYREYEFALHRELTDDENKQLAREFVQDQFCGRGMGAKLNFHFDVDEDGNRKPHVHVVILTRPLTEKGLSHLKERDWNKKELAKEWREQFCHYSNFVFKQKGLDIILDPRTYAEQGIDLEPQVKIGRNVAEMEARHKVSSQQKTAPHVTDKAKDFEETKLENLYKLMSSPDIALKVISKNKTTFSENDIKIFLFRYVDDQEVFQSLLTKIKNSKELVALSSSDNKNLETEDQNKSQTSIFTTRTLVKKEQDYLKTLTALKDKKTHKVKDRFIEREISRTNKELSHKYGSTLSEDQVLALRHMVKSDQACFIEGYAGAGKTTVIETAASIWKKSGYNVIGLAPTGRASDGLMAAGIESYTVHSFLKSYAHNRQQYNKKTVFVLDEAGMLDLERYKGLVEAVNTLGVKLVSVGDRGQLTPVEAGCPYTMASELYEFQTLHTVIRQMVPWQREATVAFGSGKAEEALSSYLQNGCVSFIKERDQSCNDKRQSTKETLIDQWQVYVGEHPHKKSVILAHNNKDVADLNTLARSYMKENGYIQGKEYTYTVESLKEGDLGQTRTVQDERSFAKGDQLLFTKNDKGLDVKNGTIGTVTSLSRQNITVHVKDDSGERDVSFSPNLYKSFEQGWALTIHKSQGCTVDRSFVLGSRGLYSNLSYVALSRQKEDTTLFVSDRDFSSLSEATKWMSRSQEENSLSKEMTVEQVQEVISRESGLFESAFEKARNKIEAVRYVGSRKLKSLFGFSRDKSFSGSKETTVENITNETGVEHHGQALGTQQGSYKPENSSMVKGMEEFVESHKRGDTDSQQGLYLSEKSLSVKSGERNGEAEKINRSCEIKTQPLDYGNIDLDDVKNTKSNTGLSKEDFNKFVSDVNRTVNAEALSKDLFRADGINEKLSTSEKMRFGSKGSLVVNIEGSHAGTWHNFESGEGGNMLSLVQKEKGLDFKGSLDFMKPYCSGSVQQDIEGFLKGERGRDIPSAERSASMEANVDLILEKAEDRRRLEGQKISDVKSLIDKSVSLEGTSAETYLREERGIKGDIPESLRYLPAGTTYDYNGKDKTIYSGALVAIAKDSYGNTNAPQLTYLTKEGGRYKNHDGLKATKMTHGVQKGAFVELQKGRDGEPVVMAEGVETALSLKESGVKGTIVCSLGTSNMRNIEVLSEKVVIAADWDGSYEKPSWKEIERTKDLLSKKGNDVSVILPVKNPENNLEKVDFNDVLKTGGVNAIKEILNNQDQNLLKEPHQDKMAKEKSNDRDAITGDETKAQGHKHGFSTKTTKGLEKTKYPHKASEKGFDDSIMPLQKNQLKEQKGMPPTKKIWKDHFAKNEANNPKKEKTLTPTQMIMRDHFGIQASSNTSKEKKIVRESKSNSKGIDLDF
jgi:Ti-type conjugative transfer relaxase TraA